MARTQLMHPVGGASGKLSLGMLLANLTIAVAAYLLGSIPTGYLLVRIFRHQDIRSVGSGNIGATNVLRSGGKGLGMATFFIDMSQRLRQPFTSADLAAICSIAHGYRLESVRNMQALAALCAVLGHMFPLWLRFSGGKGVATGFGVFLVAAPLGCARRHRRLLRSSRCSRAMSHWRSILGAASFPVFAWLFVSRRSPALLHRRPVRSSPC